jgi:hypothetical protein
LLVIYRQMLGVSMLCQPEFEHLKDTECLAIEINLVQVVTRTKLKKSVKSLD